MPAKITVVIPVHNAEDYVAECLDSVTGQTLRDMEIICIDDASTDSSLRICSSAASEDDRIVVLHLDENVGAARARNEAISRATGDYLAFIDADDWYPDDRALEKLYRAAVESGADIVGGSLSEFDSNTNEVITDYSGRGHLEAYQFTAEGFVDYADWQNDLGWIRFIYRRSFLIENDVTFPPLTRHEDPVFLVRAMLAAGRFYAIPDIVYRYRIFHKPLSLSRENLQDALIGMGEVMALARSHGLSTLEGWTYETFIWFASLSPQLKQVKSERDALRAECIELNGRCDELRRMLNDVSSSKSYRLGKAITAPYRVLSTVLAKRCGR